MKMKCKYWLVVLFLMINTFIYAQAPDFNDDVQDVPVNQYLYIFLIIGLGLGYYFLKRKKAFK